MEDSPLDHSRSELQIADLPFLQIAQEINPGVRPSPQDTFTLRNTEHLVGWPQSRFIRVPNVLGLTHPLVV